MIAAGLAKIDRVGKMGTLRLGDFAESIFFLVGVDILPRRFDFAVAGDAKAVMVIKSFLRRAGAAFVDDQAPVGVGMLDRCFTRLAFNDFHGQEIGKNRQRFVKRAAFIMAGDESSGF